MNNFQKFTSQIRAHLFIILLVQNTIVIASMYVAWHVLGLEFVPALTFVIGMSLVPLFLFTWLSAIAIVRPYEILWQAILHIAPNGPDVPAPDLEHAPLSMGRELVTTLVGQLYQLASVVDTVEQTAKKSSDLRTDFVANNLPLPLVVLDHEQTILFANRAFAEYIGTDPASELKGQNLYAKLDLSFPSDSTLDDWLADAQATKPVATKTWERVRVNPSGTSGQPKRLCDLAAYYNKDNPRSLETILVLFDHTEQYSQDDQAVSFVALAVHELRTPLTLLRGYIEVFEEEFGDQLSPSLQGFMQKMSASAQQLSAFINNMLNVARVEDDQMELQLHKEDWAHIVESAAADLRLRAEVRGISLTTDIAADLPPVAVDRVSIYEVISNLVDNAIKYSGASKTIAIHAALGRDGTVETTVQDFGVGIPEGALGNLFEKFYRNHRNRAQVGGTGLGLYLSKAIVTAHGGQIWVKSKEGQGTTFGFTVLPFAQLAGKLQTGNNGGDIVRSAHGWIKNHSLYRR